VDYEKLKHENVAIILKEVREIDMTNGLNSAM